MFYTQNVYTYENKIDTTNEEREVRTSVYISTEHDGGRDSRGMFFSNPTERMFNAH